MHWESLVTNSRPGKAVDIGYVDGRTLEAYGYYRSTGLPAGQVADYRKALPDGRGIHIRIYRNRATAHLDRRDPSVDLVGHLVQDAPVFTAALVAGAAWLYRRTKNLPA